MLGTAKARGYLERHPMAGIRDLPEPRPDIDPLSPEEIRRCLVACPARWRPYCRVAFGTGLRPSEQLALRREALDFGRRKIRIRVARTRSGEHEPRTRRSDRTIDMLPDVAAALREQFDLNGTASPYLFATRDGRPVSHGKLARRVWGPTLRRPGLRYRNPYQTRHTFASLALAAGEDPAWVGRMLGDRLQTLFERYTAYVRNRPAPDGRAFTRFLDRGAGDARAEGGQNVSPTRSRVR